MPQRYKSFKDQGAFINSIDYLIPSDKQFTNLDDKIKWLKEKVEWGVTNRSQGIDTRLNKAWETSVVDHYKPLHPSLNEFKPEMVHEEVRTWLEH